MKRSPSKRIELKTDVTGPENILVRASFSPEILQAGAVKGLRQFRPLGKDAFGHFGSSCV